MLTFQMWMQNLSSTNWLQLTRNILTLKHAENIEIYHVDLILVNSSQTTIISQPLSDDLNEDVKANTLSRRNNILSIVKTKINAVLDPSKPEYNPCLTVTEVLTGTGVSEEQYYWALCFP